MSGVNSAWLRGYADPPPEKLIVLGIRRERREQDFESCRLGAHITDQYGVKNDESDALKDIWVCTGLRGAWPDF